MRPELYTTLLVGVFTAGVAVGGNPLDPLGNSVRNASRPTQSIDTKGNEAHAKAESTIGAYTPGRLPKYVLRGRGEITFFGPFRFEAVFTRTSNGTFKEVVRFIYDRSKWGTTTFIKDGVQISDTDDGGFTISADGMPLINTERSGTLSPTGEPLYDALPHKLTLHITPNGAFNGSAQTVAGAFFNFSGSYQVCGVCPTCGGTGGRWETMGGCSIWLVCPTCRGGPA